MRMLLIGCLAAVIFVQPYSAAQAVQIVRGVVVDSAGAVIPGATVTLKTADGTTLSTVTDEHGSFTFARALIGRATLTVQLPGFNRDTREIRIDSREVSVTITLTIGALQERSPSRVGRRGSTLSARRRPDTPARIVSSRRLATPTHTIASPGDRRA